MDKQSEAAITTFIERLGLSAEADGLPRIAGRMMAFFIIHGGPFSFSDIAERLQISRGSVSTNARILRGLGILERVSKPGDRQDYYQLAKQPFRAMLDGYVYRMSQNQNLVLDAIAQIGSEAADTQFRLEQMRDFYQVAIDNTRKITAELG